MSEKDNKAKLIIEAAQKRFGLYGVEKTSMREIADDLQLSKASIYYYFHDKESLYRAVVEKEQNEFIVKISERILSIEEPEMLLKEYASSRLSYFKTKDTTAVIGVQNFIHSRIRLFAVQSSRSTTIQHSLKITS